MFSNFTAYDMHAVIYFCPVATFVEKQSISRKVFVFQFIYFSNFTLLTLLQNEKFLISVFFNKESQSKND